MAGHMTVTPAEDPTFSRVLPSTSFFPDATVTYRVTNDGDAPISVTVTSVSALAVPDVAAFDLEAGAYQDVVFTPDPVAIGAVAGTFTDTITFTDTTNVATVGRTLTINQPLIVTQGADTAFRKAPPDGDINLASITITVTNGGADPVQVTVSTDSYLTADQASFNLLPAGVQVVTLTPTAAMAALTVAGDYESLVQVDDVTNAAAGIITVPVLLPMDVESGEVTAWRSLPSGTWTEPIQVAVNNAGASAVAVAVAVANGYLTPDSAAFTVPALDSVVVTFTPTASAEALTPTASYTETVTFSDVTDAANPTSTNRDITLQIQEAPRVGVVGAGV